MRPLELSANPLITEPQCPGDQDQRSITADNVLRFGAVFRHESSVLDQSAGQLPSRGGDGCLRRARREPSEATPGRLIDRNELALVNLSAGPK